MDDYPAAILRAEKGGRKNKGVVSREAALAAGLSEAVLARLVRSGRWIRLQNGAYVPAGVPVTWHTRLAAVEASLGPTFLFSHRTAGALMGLDGVPDGFVEIVTHTKGRAADVVLHRLAALDRPRSASFQGFRTTNVERTLLDLFAVLTPRDAELALEDALRRRMTTIERLWAQVEDLARPGRNGIRAFRLCVLMHDDRDGTLQSRMETRLRKIVKGLAGPQAMTQFPVTVGDLRYRLDLAYPDVQLGIEAHSLRWHKGRERWVKDLRRDRRLKSVGWTMIYFPWDDIQLRPDDVAAEILQIRTDLERALFIKT